MHYRAPPTESADAATVTTLTDEVGQGVYCRRMRVSALQCRNAWLGLCDFVFAQLKSQRGVSLPGLGSFAVGPCVDTYNGGVLEQRAPVFVMAQKFEGIPQARGRFFLTKPATYARIPTAALAERCGVHKAGASHVLKEIIALIAEKLLAGDPVDVDFTFGRLRNVHHGGRAEFAFHQSFLNECGIIREGAAGPPRGDAFITSTAKALTKKINRTTPKLERERLAARAARASQAKFEVTSETVAPSEHPGATFSFARRRRSAAASKDPALDPAPGPATDEGARFVAICASLDRLKQGVVDRVKAERALNSDECASLALATPASACLAALAKHACGREGRYVRYAPLALDLEAAAEEEALRRRLPDPAWVAEELAAKAEAAAAAAAAEAAATAEAAAAAEAAAKAAIDAVLRGPADAAEPIAELFREHGAGARGLSRHEVSDFNRSYAPAVARFNKDSAGGVTPKATNNRALELAEGPRRPSPNALGRALQEQIDTKLERERAERRENRAIDEARVREAAESLAAEEAAVRAAREATRASLLAGWEAQKTARSRPNTARIVKFDELK